MHRAGAAGQGSDFDRFSLAWTCNNPYQLEVLDAVQLFTAPQ
jgi:hypothetical protein